MEQDVQFFAIVKCGDGYDTEDEVIGYADNEASAQQMLKQAQILNPYCEYQIGQIRVLNFLFKKP